MKFVISVSKEFNGNEMYFDKDPIVVPENNGFLLGDNLQFDLRAEFSPNKYLYVFEQNGRKAFVDGASFSLMRDNAAYLRSTFQMPDFSECLVCAVWFNETYEDSIVLFNRGVNPKNLSTYAVVLRNSKLIIETLIEHGASSAASILRKKFLARRQTTMGISTQESVANLEKQVDLLTKLCVTLVQGSNLDFPAWKNDFVSLVNKYCYTTVIEPSELLQEIALHKSKVRELQKQYHLIKSSM